MGTEDPADVNVRRGRAGAGGDEGLLGRVDDADAHVGPDLAGQERPCVGVDVGVEPSALGGVRHHGDGLFRGEDAVVEAIVEARDGVLAHRRVHLAQLRRRDGDRD